MLTLFAVCKDEWNTKEDTGKSMKKVASNSEKIESIPLAIVDLH